MLPIEEQILALIAEWRSTPYREMLTSEMADELEAVLDGVSA